MPSGSELGSNIPVPLIKAGDQVPPVSGVPARPVIRSIVFVVSHRFSVPLLPASGPCKTVTVIVAESSGHAVVPLETV